LQFYRLAFLSHYKEIILASIPDSSSQDPSSDRVVAAVDLGSNSFHMIVARIEAGALRVVDRHREMVRLADGLDDSNMLSDEARWRALGCLRRFGQRLRELDSRDVRAVGTNTFRAADNAAEFLGQAEQALGHPIDIISGVEEARLIYSGVSHSLETQDERRLVVDIGGGSTELILGDGLEAQTMNSFYMGCVSMSQRYFTDGVIDEARMQLAETAAKQELEPVEGQYQGARWDVALGASGTIKSAARIAFENGWCEEQSVISKRALKQIRKALIDAGHFDNIKLKGLVSQRIPVVCGGIAILRALFSALKIDEMRVSSGALREGLLHDLVGRIQHHDVRDHSVGLLASRCNIDEAQAGRVRDIAVLLYEKVAGSWKLSDESYGQMLAWAAHLHECGTMVAFNQYHKHGAYIISNANLNGFTQQEQQLLAVLVRAHRRKFPLAEVKALPARWSKQALRLAILLRISFTLNRGRTDTGLSQLDAKVTKNSIDLAIPDDWLDFHPLTKADLVTESGLLAAIGYSLTVNSRPPG
jgi:exopolyphosphatase/guanosine-5'-triphosphate,3'-diphosphate pyrophosphatase